MPAARAAGHGSAPLRASSAASLVNGFLKPSGGLAGRCCERDKRRRRSRSRSLLAEQGDDAGDSGRLARARSTGDDRQPTQHRRGSGDALTAVGLARRTASLAGL